jgi:pentatricopeptide repeat protein
MRHAVRFEVMSLMRVTRPATLPEQAQQFESAMGVWREMRMGSAAMEVDTCNAMLIACIEAGHGERALELFGSFPEMGEQMPRARLCIANEAETLRRMGDTLKLSSTSLWSPGHSEAPDPPLHRVSH